jgi:hypothetical protein
MMTAEQYPDNYVSAIINGQIRIKRAAPELIPLLRSMGGSEQQIAQESVWVLNAISDQMVAILLSQLRDLGVLFADQPSGWPPAAVFEELRDKGYIQGEFQAVTWQRPGQWSVTSK